MFLKQLSVFIENRKGRLEDVLKILKENNINIISLSLADTEDYGVLRLIVSDPEAARGVLKENGFSAVLTEVLAVRLAHSVGQLQELLEAICEAQINVEYMYAMSTGIDDACIVLKPSDLTRTGQLLSMDGVELVTRADIEKM